MTEFVRDDFFKTYTAFRRAQINADDLRFSFKFAKRSRIPAFVNYGNIRPPRDFKSVARAEFFRNFKDFFYC